MTNPWLNVALFRPEIPQNTGNIGRSCVGLNIPLHIIGRPSFFLDDAKLKRAGLDYWEHLKLIEHENFEKFFQTHPSQTCYFFTKSGKNNLFDLSFKQGDFLIFGRETEGLPPEIIEKFKSQTVYLPIEGPIRSFNLSNTVAVAAFEAYRQIKKL